MSAPCREYLVFPYGSELFTLADISRHSWGLAPAEAGPPSAWSTSGVVRRSHVAFAGQVPSGRTEGLTR
jgi:hypothetical protein